MGADNSELRNYLSETRKMSGEINDDDPLIAFLYILMRDHVPAGTVGKIMKDLVDNDDMMTKQFTNGWLACYAMYIRKQLKSLKRK